MSLFVTTLLLLRGNSIKYSRTKYFKLYSFPVSTMSSSRREYRSTRSARKSAVSSRNSQVSYCTKITKSPERAVCVRDNNVSALHYRSYVQHDERFVSSLTISNIVHQSNRQVPYIQIMEDDVTISYEAHLSNKATSIQYPESYRSSPTTILTS